MGDKCEITEHPELTGRQVGDKWETSLKSCGSTESIQGLLGDKWETSGRQMGNHAAKHSEHPELTGRQVGDKWETSLKSCGQSTESIETTGRQVGDKWKQMGDKYKIMWPEH